MRSDTFFRTINWSPVEKSAQQVSNKNSNDIISRDTMHWTDGFAYLYQWICPIFCRFGPNLYDISPHPLGSLRPRLRSFGSFDFCAVFLQRKQGPVSFDNYLFFKDISCWNLKVFYILKGGYVCAGVGGDPLVLGPLVHMVYSVRTTSHFQKTRNRSLQGFRPLYGQLYFYFTLLLKECHPIKGHRRSVCCWIERRAINT